MKRITVWSILVLLCLLTPLAAVAVGYGDDQQAVACRYRVTGKANVRSKPDVKRGAIMYTLRAGDYIYVDEDREYEGNGSQYNWVKISGSGYVSLRNLAREDNPHYTAGKIQVYHFGNTRTIDKFKTVAKWFLLILAVVLAGMSLFFFAGYCQYHNVLAECDKRTGMQRTFFYRRGPYFVVLMVSALLIASSALALASVLAIGALGFIMFWILILLCYALALGALVAIGWGLIAIFSSDENKGIGCWSIVGGGLVLAVAGKFNDFTMACQRTASDFFQAFNLWDFARDLVAQYGLTVLIVCVAPVVIMAALAIVAFVVAGVLRLVEYVETSAYNINHKCPHCQQVSEPAVYLSQGEPLPVNLRPGVYGLFHVTHPDTGEHMPTMLLNGRDKLPRECCTCHNILNAREGTDKHVAFVGVPGSGKTTIIYRAIAHLQELAGGDVSIMDVTDFDAITASVRDIREQGYVANFPAKTSQMRHRSIRLSIKRAAAPVPYVLFINDAAGESYTGGEHDQLVFASNIAAAYLLIDPFTTDWSEMELSDRFDKWLRSKNIEPTDGAGKWNVEAVFDSFTNLIRSRGTAATRRVTLNVVLVKKDEGYLGDMNDREPTIVKAFVERDMGLARLVARFGEYAAVNYMAVSATIKGRESNVDQLVAAILEQTGIALR